MVSQDRASCWGLLSGWMKFAEQSWGGEEQRERKFSYLLGTFPPREGECMLLYLSLKWEGDLCLPAVLGKIFLELYSWLLRSHIKIHSLPSPGFCSDRADNANTDGKTK